MAISAEQRREINRKNASRSTGPKTKEGKEKARQSALTHGLRTEALALPNENAEELARLTDEWLEYYQPASPGMRAMLDGAVYATVQRQRCRRFVSAAVADQVRRAVEDFDDQQAEQVAEFKALLKDDPAAAVRGLKRSARGCRWLLNEWALLKETFDEEQCWMANAERDQALRLLKLRPEELKTDPEVYTFCFRNLSAREKPNETMLRWYLHPQNMPEMFHRYLLGGGAMDREESVAYLREMIEGEVDLLTEREERLRLNIEEPGRAEAGERALLLEGELGARYARYERMHELAFHRSFKALLNGEPMTDEEKEAAAASAPLVMGDGRPKMGAPDGSWMRPEDHPDHGHLFRPAAEVAVLDITAARPVAPNEANSIPTLEAAPPLAEGRNEAYAELDRAIMDALTGPERVTTLTIDFNTPRRPTELGS